MRKKLLITFFALLLGLVAFSTEGLKLGQNYPNPAKGKTYIEVGFDGPVAQFKVINILGKVVMHRELTESGTFILDVTEFPDGVYIYSLESDGEKVTKRLTVKN